MPRNGPAGLRQINIVSAKPNIQALKPSFATSKPSKTGLGFAFSKLGFELRRVFSRSPAKRIKCAKVGLRRFGFKITKPDFESAEPSFRCPAGRKTMSKPSNVFFFVWLGCAVAKLPPPVFTAASRSFPSQTAKPSRILIVISEFH